jgi:hypothetical protein
MDIVLEIPRVITIPDWAWYVALGLFILIGGYGAIRIFFPREPNPWLRGG